ncbi:SubName: Full=Uncharacterized protein {ECO:0000313/EMBL:CCA68257.1} [Serendipita indica DSM 11827]|uniref:Uncharacterized protein n=1 Tax=Serendipita indica (strain DSM 11827) TaxID=1109443 RepID=G4TAB4_SERID|nr:SubName: Full=Uncharacterized protein {ECO:0000313/EMBL:CCA68257.1} [Serendipita indica DSM 11827]CCA68257.1 hypothetical protein PIIN_02122 [Serendipita indica DSM 11827]
MNYFRPLRDAYLYDLIVSIIAVVAGMIMCIPGLGRPAMLFLLLLFSLLFIGGFGWTEAEHIRHAHHFPYYPTSTSLVVFLGILGFGGFLIFLIESAVYIRSRRVRRIHVTA